MKNLNDEERNILHSAIVDIQKKHTRALLPEEEKLFDGIDYDSPGAGYHIHNEDNPTGLHRHSKDDEIDGAHIHTILNPYGEHAHGLLEGMSLIDGRHTHDYLYDLGYHSHDRNKEDSHQLESEPEIL